MVDHILQKKFSPNLYFKIQNTHTHITSMLIHSKENGNYCLCICVHRTEKTHYVV